MQFLRLLPLTFLFVGTSQFASAQIKPPTEEVSGLVHWVYDLEEGRQQALIEDKPMFVVFRCER